MTLTKFLSTLDSTTMVAIILDSDGKTELSEIKTCTYASLEDELEAREVDNWSIVGTNKIKIILKGVQDNG